MDATLNLKRGSLLDDGPYRLRIDSIEQKPGGSGYNYLNITYSVHVNGQPHGGAIWDIVSLSPKSRYIFDQFLDAVGAPNTDEEVTTRWFKGKYLYANLTTGEYKGKLKNEVDSYIAASVAEKFLEAGGGVEDLNEDPNEDVDFVTKKEPAKRTGKSKAAVAEMVAENDSFPL